MKLSGAWQRVLVGLLVFLMAVPAPVFAQSSVPVFRQEELEQILAPIALYPDSLLAQVLMAATYPVEVVQADRWVRQNRNLPPEVLYDALERQDWDPSVKALVPFPDVLSMMSERLDWTQMVGDAFLAQEADVMYAIQQLRAEAYAAGYLRSTQQQIVTREGTIIIVQPANPQVVYVPVYNPSVVYGGWRYPAYPPVVVYPSGAVIAAGIITFGIGIAVASAWNHWWGYWDWGHRDVYVNVNRNVNINRTTVIHTREIQTTSWRHDPGHRKGVAYRDPGTREKFAPTNRQGVDNRRDFRGYDQTGPARPGSTVSRPATVTRTAPAVSKPAPQTKTAPAITSPAPAAKPGPATVARPSTQAKPAQTISRPAPANTIYGVDQGSKTRVESARGRDSLSSSKGKGNGSSKPPGVSKPAPAKKTAPAQKTVPAQGGVKQEGGGPGRK